MSGKQNKEITDAILNEIANKGCVSTQEIADLLKTTPAVSAGRLTYLRKQGRIVGKKGRWAFRMEHLNIKPKELLVNQTFKDLSVIFDNIIRMGLSNEKTQHS
jgi:hypothetical protein